MTSNVSSLVYFLRKHVLAVAFLSILLLLGSGSFYQLTSELFYCGITEARPEIIYWTIAVVCQSVLFMIAPLFPWAKKSYSLSQIAALPFLAAVLVQLADVYPRPFLLVLVMLGGYGYLSYLTPRLFGNNALVGHQPSAFGLVVEGTLFTLTTLLIHSALAFFVLHTPGIVLTNHWFWGIFIGSAGLAYFLVRNGCGPISAKFSAVPPVFLLVMILLRYKLPAMAYDDLLYKATGPIMIADWRTALTGILDHNLLATNFLEIVNSQLRILDPAYSPAMTGALAFMALWILAPAVIAAALSRNATGQSSIVAHAGILLLVSLTEPLNAAGTAYQEPTLILLIAASVLAGPLGWFMMASAAAVKITALFFVPFLLFWRAITVDRAAITVGRGAISKVSGKFRWFRRRINILHLFAAAVAPRQTSSNATPTAVVLLSILLACLVLGEQFHRNYTFAGRLLAPSEILASITDPNGEILKRVKVGSENDAASRDSILSRLGRTAVHMATFDKWIKVGEWGFYVFPSSRLPLVAVLLCMVVLLLRGMRTDKELTILGLAYVLSFVATLVFLEQGRYMAAASASAIFFVVAVLGRLCALTKENEASFILTCLGLGVAYFAVGDQMVGSYNNLGWDCHRPLLAATARPGYEKLSDDVDKTLAKVVRLYRDENRDEVSIIPSILCEPKVERRPYFGANYVYYPYSTNLTRRFLDVDTKRAEVLPNALLALCYENEQFMTGVLPPSIRDQFTHFAKVGKVNILVSERLLSGESVRSLTGKGFTSLQWAKPQIPDIKVLKWGPQSTLAGMPFNVQPSGHSAIWIASTGAFHPETIEGWFGNKKVTGFWLAPGHGGGGGMAVSKEQLAVPGKYPVYLKHTPTNTRIDLGTFEVLPNPTAIPNIRIVNWGPRETLAGMPFNVQPSGHSAIWIASTGVFHPETIEGWFGNKKGTGLWLAPGHGGGGGMAVSKEQLAVPGKYPVYLKHIPTNTRFDLGTFEVLPSPPDRKSLK